ncbi:NMD3 family-domain-containing protein [Mycotypha africana]|uniref:NMD3 family-domain-containing protein n=1 Tax=Mycotypha africana TaxID=64632 RepID=UPI0023010CBB|nr:NMD3 family-domain-containing protein [Mycotypha africana]KAI8991451.1 NMD3 family-domain-containing protein [Mycotypha africana]
MCVNCIRNEVDITEGIPKQATIHFCRNCERYLQPPGIWVTAQLESRELLTLCLKKLKGLNKVRLIDAGFIWTEPHSRRIKVKLTIQKEVFVNTILQQIFEVEFVVSHQQCDECTRLAAQNTWKAVVQVRQKVDHKRTFLYLEQLILKHNAHKDTTNIKETKDGIDFYYGARSHAIKMVEFLSAVVPLRYKTSEQLISKDIHTSVSNYKFTYSAEIAPVCKDDLVCIPKKLSNTFGNINQLLICTRISNSIQLLDPHTLAMADVTTTHYYRYPFQPLASAKAMIEFYVLDVEPLGPVNGRNVLCDVHVARMSDFGRNDEQFIVRSHLGAILNPGDTVMGYDLARANFNNDEYEKLHQQASLPDIVLVRKSYPARKKRSKPRNWKLQQLGKEVDEMLPRKQDQAKIENDMELFMRDIEEDPEFRSTINIFKNPNASKQTMAMDNDEIIDSEEEELPEISLEEMLDEMAINMDDDDDDENTAAPLVTRAASGAVVDEDEEMEM